MSQRILHISKDLSLPIGIANKTICIFGKGGSGKALALETPLPTPTGWTTMGEVEIGDWLFDETGQPCRATATTPVMLGNSCYRLEFSDRSSIIADGEHLWKVDTHVSRRADSLQVWREARGGGKTRRDRWQCVRRTWPATLSTSEMASDQSS